MSKGGQHPQQSAQHQFPGGRCLLLPTPDDYRQRRRGRNHVGLGELDHAAQRIALTWITTASRQVHSDHPAATSHWHRSYSTKHSTTNTSTPSPTPPSIVYGQQQDTGVACIVAFLSARPNN